MKIQIDFEVSDAAMARVQQLLDDSALRDIDFNGEQFELVRGDGTCIVDSESADAATLLTAVFAEIDGSRDVPAGMRMTAKGEMFDA